MNDREASALFLRTGRVIPRIPLYAKSHRSRGNDSFLMNSAHKHERTQSYEVIPNSANDDRRIQLRRQSPGSLFQWSSELISCLVMLGVLAAIIGILLPNDGQTIPQWPLHASLNTVIAVLTTILKTCAMLILMEGISQLKWEWFTRDRPLHDLVLFDRASRGPWGCVRLIFSGCGGRLNASLGAVLIVLNFAIDPFTQQVIRYYDCNRISTTAQATLPRSIYYDEAADETALTIWRPTTIVLGYIDQGIYNPSVLQAPYVCGSGNCTFKQSFSTIGFCATCEDMSARLAFKTGTIQTEVFNKTANKTESMSSYFVITTLPSGSYATTGDVLLFNASWLSLNHTRTANTNGWTDIIQASHAYPDAEPNWQQDHFYASAMRHKQNRGDSGCSTAYENATWACQGFGGAGAARCRFKPCVRTYVANIEKGKLEEKLTSTYEDMLVGTDELGLPIWIAADLKCAGELALERLAKAGFSVNSSTTIIPWSVTVNDTDGTASILSTMANPSISSITVPGPLLNSTDLPRDIIPAKCIYRMRYRGQKSIRDYLVQYLSGSLNVGTNGASVTGPPQLLALHNDTYASFDSINNTFHSIAETITLRMRQFQPSNALPVAEAARGDVIEHNTCVRVRWAYLTFPVAIVSLTIFFLIGTIVTTNERNTGSVVPVWKSSPLPAMFHVLEMLPIATVDEHQNTVIATPERPSSVLKVMEGTSKRMNARLNLDGEYFT